MTWPGAAAVAIVISLSATGLSEAQGVPSFGGRLYHSVSDASTDSPFTNNDRASVPVSLRVRFDNFVRCRASFRSGLPSPTTFFEKAASTHQRTLERALTCLFVTPGIAAAATEYARNARILYEWEGEPSSPIEEATYAEAYVAEHPRSPFVPYLYLFAAERWRYAFEYFARDRDSEGVASSSTKYRDLIARARIADPLIRLVANDLDEQPYLDSDVGRHPRDP
jgi:hypothetical protein